MKHVLLQSPSFLGDEVVFTGAVRELQHETGWNLSIKTGAPDLWIKHPAVHKTNPECVPDDTRVIIQHHCPPFRGMSQVPVHFLEQYVRNLRVALGLKGEHRISKFAGEVPVSTSEAEKPPFGLNPRYWVVAAGCKTGVPVKGWGVKNYQDVVDMFRGRILFVQVGSKAEWHPPLHGVVDLVGKTSLRELIHLIHHAEGVLCPITSLMHLAAAVPVAKDSRFSLRPCVVIGGGREAPHFIQYPAHRVLNTVGLLSCCATGGCGKSRFGQGQCQYPEGIGEGVLIPRCMDMIKPVDVVAAIEFYFRGDAKLPRTLGRVAAIFAHLRRRHSGAAILRGAEIGVFKGEMSAQLLLGHLGLQLVMADRWQRSPDDFSDPSFYSQRQSFFDEARQTALEATAFAQERRSVIAKPSVLAAQEVECGTLDFVFVDADHSYEGCKQDIEAWYPKLKDGGLLCGHDYERLKYPREGVKRAVDEFAAAKQLHVEKDKDNTWFIHLPNRDAPQTELDSHFRPI
jgi:hypothetical protein